MNPESADITLVYFFGTVGMMLLAGGLFFFFVFYQKRLLQKQLELNQVKQEQQEEILVNTIQAQENERKRIAQDLHDEVGAMLSVVKLNIARIEKQSSDKPQQLAAETKTYLDEVITQVRRISRALLPSSLEKLGLYSAVEELVNWVNKSDQLTIEFRKNGEPFRFEIKQELAVFRVIQEVLNNAIKHADATTIRLVLRFGSTSLGVLISDNGKGFDLEEKLNTGLGLKNLESRAEIAGARFRLKSKPGRGTSAILLIQKDGK
jgi:signal transduction histidine kinase